MTHIKALIEHIDEILKPELFEDYCPNGLQVAGKNEIKIIVTGVTACQALLDEAVKLKADAILVHHGYFWKGEDPRIIDLKKQRIKTLLENEMNLLAYHLPLDAYPEFGNNAQLAKRLGINVDKSSEDKTRLLNSGMFAQGLSGAELKNLIQEKFNREPLYIEGTKTKINRVAWCTGAAQDFLEKAIAINADAYITGEVSERTFHIAKESGIHFYAAGHHATERDGIRSLGEHLAKEFAIKHHFVDIENPV